MKKLITISFALLFSIALIAQDDYQEMQTLLSKGRISHGAYGALSFNYTQINGKDAMLVGAKGAWVIDHGLSVGFAGYGFANDIYFDDVLDGGSYVGLAGGYGGILIEPIIFPNFPVHLALPVILGAGAITYVDDYYNYHDFHDYNDYDADAFFVIEPGVELELNLVRFIRVGIGAYYRFTTDISLQGVKKDVLNGFSTGITFKFGKF